ncbi:MAG: dihydrodipicolinate synthase family protein [Candidatus Hermodarchaeota archaeon]
MMRVKGIIVPCITFLDKNYNINRELNSLLIKHIILNGADSIFIFGNTGEGVDLYDKVEQRIEYIDIALKYTKNDVPILIGVFGNNPEGIINQIELIGNKYENLNFIIAPPFSKKLKESEIVEFLENILSSVKVSNQFFLYNNPNKFANNEINENLLKQLLKYPNLKGIKDTTDDINNVKSFLKFFNDDFSIFCGEENNYSTFLKLIPLEQRKYSGLVPSISNISRICYIMFQKALKGEDSQLEKLQEELNKQNSGIYDDKGPMGREPRGLKQAFYYIYKDMISATEKDTTFVSENLQRSLEVEIKNMINKTVGELIKSSMILKSE